MLRHGLDVEEVVSSDLPGIPNAVWTTKLKEDGKSSFLVLENFAHITQILTTHTLSYRS